MSAKKKSSKSTSEKSVSQAKDIGDSVAAASPKQPTVRAHVRPVVLKYLTAQEYLLRKGVNPNHIPVYVAKAGSLGYTKATASEWEKLLFSGS